MTSKRSDRVARILAAAVLAAVIPAYTLGQSKATRPPVSGGRTVEPAATPLSMRVAAHADTTYAHELLRLNQGSLIKLMAGQTGGASDLMWKAESIMLDFDQIKSRSEARRQGQEYASAMNAYLDKAVTQRDNSGLKIVPDGFWAVDHVKFIFGDLTKSLITRVEYFGMTERDRTELRPIAELSDKMVSAAETGLTAICEFEEKKKRRADDDGFAEGTPWARAYEAKAIPQYYRAFANYYRALAMQLDDPQRKDCLVKAVDSLKDWIEPEDAAQKAVKNTALLLRGKCNSEIGRYSEALRDFEAAKAKENMPLANPDKEDSKERLEVPNWIVFQARYQTIVTKARNKDFEGARVEYASLREAMPKDKAAQISMDMLRFRIDWMDAEAKSDAERDAARATALKQIADAAAREPESRELIFEQLTATIPDSMLNSGKLLPLQALAVAWGKAVQARTDESNKSMLLSATIRYASEARNNAAATKWEKLEAVWLEAISHAQLEHAEQAATMCLEFAESSGPTDSRYTPMLDACLAQLHGMLTRGVKLSPAMQDVKKRALDLKASGSDPDSVKWYYANALTLTQDGKLPALKKALTLLDRIPPSDPNWFDAQFQKLHASAKQLDILNVQKASVDESKEAARTLVNNCRKFEEMLESPRPPQGVSKDAYERVKKLYELDVKLILIGKNLDPLANADEALSRIDKLEASPLATGLSEAQQTALLRYRILAYQIKAQPDKAIEAVNKYAEKYPERSVGIMQDLVFRTGEDIKLAEKHNNPEKAKVLAQQLVGLMGSLIKQAEAAPEDPDERKREDERHRNKKALRIYSYRQLQATMMVKAGDSKRAWEMFSKLQVDAQKVFEKDPDVSKRNDAYNFVWNAHAAYAAGEYGTAQNRYGALIPRLPQGNDVWWECYYKMILCNEQLSKIEPATAAARKAENTKALRDLKGVAGLKDIGGKYLRDEYIELLGRYGLLEGSGMPAAK